MAKREKLEATTSPSKGFFVNMLTRDIGLYDTILDLIDNSLDGVQRMGKGEDLSGHFVKIDFDGEKFKIRDNCGGIPLDVAENSAFALGRPDEQNDKPDGMIGVYGIGMKRAIFKLGRHAVLKSRSYETVKMKKSMTFRFALLQNGLMTLNGIR